MHQASVISTTKAVFHSLHATIMITVVYRHWPDYQEANFELWQVMARPLAEMA